MPSEVREPHFSPNSGPGRRDSQRKAARAVSLIYLARHGQINSNLHGRYAGFSPEPLTQIGREGVQRLAMRLSPLGLGEIWTSRVRRASESADILAATLGVPIKEDPRLDELRMGPWEGLTEHEVAARFPDDYATWCNQPDRLVLENRETLAEVAVRIAAVVSDAEKRPHPVLLMTHVAPIRVAILKTLKLPLELYRRFHIDNAECIALDSVLGDARRLGEDRSIRETIPGGSVRK